MLSLMDVGLFVPGTSGNCGTPVQTYSSFFRFWRRRWNLSWLDFRFSEDLDDIFETNQLQLAALLKVSDTAGQQPRPLGSFWIDEN